MDPVTASLVTALAAGAAAGLKNVASQTLKDAYGNVRNLLFGKLSSLANLEEDPNDEDYRKAAGTELQKKGLASDPSILQKVRELAEAIERESPEKLTEWGIDIERVHAAESVIIKNLKTITGGVRVKDVEARGGTADIEGIEAGGPKKN